MENKYENFGFNQNAFVMGDFLGFPKESSDLAITPCPIMSQTNESQNTFFMSNSLKNHDYSVISGDLSVTPLHERQSEPFIRGSHGILSRYEDLATTHANIQQYNVGGNDTPLSHARFPDITTTFPLNGQNSAPFVYDSLRIWEGMNRTGSSNSSFNNHENIAKTSRNLSRSSDKVKWSRLSRQSMKRVRFRFVQWTNEEENLMDQELRKCTFLPIKEILKKIAALLRKKSIRDVAMRVQWLIKNGKLEDKWNWVEPSPARDLSDFSFYLPDNPNDPELLAIRNRYHP